MSNDNKNIDNKNIDNENKEIKNKKEHPKRWIIVMVVLLVLIISIVCLLIYLIPKLKKENTNNPSSKKVVAVILVDASVFNSEQENYITGYRMEYHENDTSNTAKTPKVDAVLNSDSYLKYTYTVSNKTNKEMLFDIDIIKDYEAKNLKLSYKINSGEELELSEENLSGQILPSSTSVISIFIRIQDNMLDADLSGELSLCVTYFA